MIDISIILTSDGHFYLSIQKCYKILYHRAGRFHCWNIHHSFHVYIPASPTMHNPFRPPHHSLRIKKLITSSSYVALKTTMSVSSNDESPPAPAHDLNQPDLDLLHTSNIWYSYA